MEREFKSTFQPLKHCRSLLIFVFVWHNLHKLLVRRFPMKKLLRSHESKVFRGSHNLVEASLIHNDILREEMKCAFVGSRVLHSTCSSISLKPFPASSRINFFFAFIFSGSLIKSQFPVFTIYAQKSCLKMRPCERAWCIDRVQGYALKDHIKRSATAMSRQDCYEMCFGETDFLCR